MIVLTTGLPGAGKTLLTLVLIKELSKISESESRPVYYHGISELTLPWIPLEDPTKWFDVAPNSIVIIDECQKTFRPRASGSSVPKHVEMLETHRHLGIDLYLITQQPSLVDKNVRQLVGQHFHYVRKFGMQKVRRHEWGQCRENTTSRKDSITKDLSYPKEAFGWYKSAEVHTHKRNVPFRVYLMFILPFIALALIYYGYTQVFGIVTKAQSPGIPASQFGQQIDASGARMPQKKTPGQYLASYVPRVPDLLYTAPVYDEVTKPVTAPFPAACVTIRGECRCYSQQGTRLDVSPGLCGQIVERGFFLDFDPSGNRPGGENRQVQNVHARNDVVSAEAVSYRGAVISFSRPEQSVSSNIKK